MIGTLERFDYEKCVACGALQIASVPEDLERYYADDYYTKRHRKLTSASIGGRTLRRSWSKLRLREGWLIRLLSGRRYARFDWFRRTGTRLDDAILDVGCGSGRLLARMARAGFSELHGIDPRLPDRGQRLPGVVLIRAGPQQHSGRYRLVMAHHSFEHMFEPVEAFEAMSRLVDRKGFLLLRVPLADSWASGHYAADWVQLDAPRHLHVPTRKTIEILARRFGMRVVDIVDDSGPFQIWGSELYQHGYSLSKSGRGGRRRLSLLERLAARCRARRLSHAGLGDQAIFYLQRD